MVAIYVVSARDPLALAKAIEENQAKVKSSVVVLRDNQAIIDAFQARSIIFEERPRIESIDKSSSNAATFVVVELESATYSADRPLAVSDTTIPIFDTIDYNWLTHRCVPTRTCLALRAKVYRQLEQLDREVAVELESRAQLNIRRVLVIGSGGREHAIVSKIATSPTVDTIFIAPGNAGMEGESPKCKNVAIATNDVDTLVSFAATNNVDLVIVGPEQPLVDGIVDAMTMADIPCFGPSKAASIIEESKAWSKNFMARNHIRTATFRNFTDFSAAKEYLEMIDYRVVVKASGLAAGKGVLIPENRLEAIEAARSILAEGVFGAAGNEIVIEEFLEGEEFSLLAFSDGHVAKGMPPAQDHKRVRDNDEGLNTGGMGAYAPTPLVTPATYKLCMDIVQQTVTAMANEGIPFKGVLYAGFIVTKDGPAVLEYNCRFGDPETQVLLPLLDSDLCEVAMACVEGTLAYTDVKWAEASACTVVVAAPGYPESYRKGFAITGLAKASSVKQAKVFHAGTKLSEQGHVVTNGGRVLAITGLGATLKAAVDTSYEAVRHVHFDGAHYRRDIARKGLQRRLRIGVLGSTRGSSLQPVLDAIKSGTLHAEVVLVLSNKSAAGILERARAHQIPCRSIGALHKTREEYDGLVADALEDVGVDLVLLIGYMRIVSPAFVRRFPMRCFNVHPSLLPDFAGGMDLEVHQAVLDAGRSKSGCTVHFVTEGVDEGPIAVQLDVPVVAGETAESLKAKVQPLEGQALIQAIELFAQGVIGPAAKEVITYRTAGVDIDAGEALVDLIKPHCKSTVRSGCDAELGGFGGLFDLAQAGYLCEDTVLVSGTDGVGTKLKIAQAVGIHSTIGIDLVAMCVNDILVCGAEPLFFLDYYATGALNITEAAEVVKGIAEGCRQAGCALIGGETAEMAGMYAKGEYDMAGFSVGAVRRPNLLPRNVAAGDVLLGLASSGVHSNGYSLVRKCVERAGCQWSDPVPFTSSAATLGEALLTPTRIYVKALLPLIRRGLLKAMAHITGGGLLDNLPRVLPEDTVAVIDIASSRWQLPPVFQWLQSVANLPQDELLRTFNNGIGMVLVVSPDHVVEVIEALTSAPGSEDPVVYPLGQLHSAADPLLQSLQITTTNDHVKVVGTLQ